MAPRMLPMPPSTAAAKALMPGMKPIVLVKTNAEPNRKPAAPASAPPMMNVREIVRSMSTPMSAAVGASSAVARMLRPSLVPETRRSRKSISSRADDDDDRLQQVDVARRRSVNSTVFWSK